MTVRLVEHLGSQQLLHVGADAWSLRGEHHLPRRLVVSVGDDIRVATGDIVHLRVATGRVHAFDDVTGRRLASPMSTTGRSLSHAGALH